MTDIPQSKDEVQLGHTIVYYTFMPMIVSTIVGVVLPFTLWYFGHIDYGLAFAIPWLSVLGCCAYIGFLGDYVIPSVTYRNIRSGKWDNSND